MMGADIALQPAWQLAWAFALGLALGLLFDVYRVGFVAIKSKIWRNLADFGWWALALILFVLAMYRINGLQIRGFELALAAGGVLAEQLWISAHFTPFCAKFAAFAGKLLRGLLRFLARLVELALAPAVWLIGLILALLGRTGRLIWAIMGAIRRVLAWGTGPIWRGMGRIRRGVAGRVQGVWRQGGAPVPDAASDDIPGEKFVEKVDEK